MRIRLASSALLIGLAAVPAAAQTLWFDYPNQIPAIRGVTSIDAQGLRGFPPAAPVELLDSNQNFGAYATDGRGGLSWSATLYGIRVFAVRNGDVITVVSDGRFAVFRYLGQFITQSQTFPPSDELSLAL